MSSYLSQLFQQLRAFLFFFFMAYPVPDSEAVNLSINCACFFTGMHPSSNFHIPALCSRQPHQQQHCSVKLHPLSLDQSSGGKSSPTLLPTVEGEGIRHYLHGLSLLKFCWAFTLTPGVIIIISIALLLSPTQSEDFLSLMSSPTAGLADDCYCNKPQPTPPPRRLGIFFSQSFQVISLYGFFFYGIDLCGQIVPLS